MFEEYNLYQDTWHSNWQKSANLLERAIALPVMVNMTDERIQETAEKVLMIAKGL